MKRSKSSGGKKQRSGSRQADPAKRSRSPRSCPSPVLGLDLSLTGCGLVVWDGKAQRCLRKRRYKTEPLAPTDGLKPRPRGLLAPDRFRGDDEERIAFLKMRMLQAIRKFDIAFVVIENHAFAAKGRAKTQLAELHGVIKNALHEEEIAFVLMTPQQIKTHVTGDGKAQKIDVIFAAKKFDPKISDSDTADAWAAAKLGDDLYETLVE